MVGLTQQLRKPFSLCILPFMSLLITIFVSCVFMLRTGIPVPLGVCHPLTFITQNRPAIPHHTFTVRCRTIRFICSAYCVLSFIIFLA